MRAPRKWYGLGGAAVAAAFTATVLLPGCAAYGGPGTIDMAACDSLAPDLTRSTGPVFLNQDVISQALNRELADFEGRRRDATMLLLVDERGRVKDSKVKVSTGQSRMDQAVLRAFRLARFRPATVNCKPVELWIEWGIARN